MNKHEVIKKIIEEIMSYMNSRYSLEIADLDETSISADIEGADLSFLIGYRGESLDAMQQMVNLIAFKKLNGWGNVVIDINGYRKQRTEKIIGITKNFIDRVRFMQKDIEMPPMNAFERRQVHTFVAGYDDIISESAGEGINRKVVLKMKTH
jgi:spoIIIJ-associated protein